MSKLTAEDVLTVLNDMEPLDPAQLEIVVVTHGAEQRWNGHGFVDCDLPNFWPFDLGEVLLLNEHGREPFGECRKPGKWDVVVKECATFDEAKNLSAAVKAAPARFAREHWDAVKAERAGGSA